MNRSVHFESIRNKRPGCFAVASSSRTATSCPAPEEAVLFLTESIKLPPALPYSAMPVLPDP
jgi:hypothetical protein